MNVARPWLVLSAIALFIGALFPYATLAQAANRTVFVDDNGEPRPNRRDPSCGQPNYRLIQRAVDDPTASRIIVCPGVYTEQVTVGRSVDIDGRQDAVIRAPRRTPLLDYIVGFFGPQESRLSGFTITGAGGRDALAGVLLQEGSRVTIRDNRISDIRAEGDGFTTGHGIIVRDARATIRANTIKDYGFTGILLEGSGVTFARIAHNTIRGQGASGTNEMQSGVVITTGAEADVEANTITGNLGTFMDENAGIVVETANGGVSIRDNAVRENTQGIRLELSNAVEVRRNKVSGSTGDGIFLFDTDAALIVENASSANGNDGISLTGGSNGNTIDANSANTNAGNGIDLNVGSTGNTVTNNKAVNNGSFDIEDDNGVGANVYANNTCEDSNPPGLCAN